MPKRVGLPRMARPTQTTTRPEAVEGRVLSATRVLGRNPKTWQTGILDCNQEKDASDQSIGQNLQKLLGYQPKRHGQSNNQPMQSTLSQMEQSHLGSPDLKEENKARAIWRYIDPRKPNYLLGQTSTQRADVKLTNYLMLATWRQIARCREMVQWYA